MSDDTTGPTATAELAHEALIRSWSRLATWVDSDAAFQRWLVTMEDRVAENELLPEARINEAERWLTERPNDIPTEIREMIARSTTLLLQRIAELEKARTAAQTARRQVRLRLAVGLTVMLLVVGVLGVFTYLSHRNAQQRTELAQAAAILSYNPVESVKHAVKAYQINTDNEARSAVLTAASSPRSQVVAGPHGSMPTTVSGTASTPMTVIGMASTPDSRHIVAYDKDGSIQVIGDNGAVEHQTTVSGLRGTVTPVASTISIPLVSTAAVAPDASRIALGTDQGTVAVIDTGTGRHTDITSTADSTPTIVRWIGSATNGLVLIVSKSGIATTYNPETGQQVTRLPDTVTPYP